MSEHKHKSLTPTKNQKLYLSINKYGWDKFRWEVLYESWDSEYCLSVVEPLFIQEYDSYNTGLNSTIGGEGANLQLLSASIKSLWDDPLSKYNSAEFRKKKSLNSKRHWDNPTSKHNSDEFRENAKIKSSKVWSITDPSGTTHTVVGMKQFCESNGISYITMQKAAASGSVTRKGWSVKLQG